MLKLYLTILGVALLLSVACEPRSDEHSARALISAKYDVVSNVNYVTADGWVGNLDIYIPKGTAAPNPTLIYIHGGAWARGSKEASVSELRFFLDAGWTVVSVEYRLSNIAPAPAAIEDCQCALEWVERYGPRHHFDLTKLVIAGHSAGGHLALMTGMSSQPALSASHCQRTKEVRVAAIINWAGITDVVQMLEWPAMRAYTAEWLGEQAGNKQFAGLVSPVTYVREGLPPIMTIHGDHDPVVPYSQAVKFHAALNSHHVPNYLFTVPGGLHGEFSRQQAASSNIALKEFLTAHGLTPSVKATPAQ